MTIRIAAAILAVCIAMPSDARPVRKHAHKTHKVSKPQPCRDEKAANYGSLGSCKPVRTGS